MKGQEKYIEIITQKDADELIEIFGNFHDSCIKELRYISGAYVESDLGMYPINSKREVSIIFQRQWENPTAIEMVFSKLERLNLEPHDENYDGIIYGALLRVEKGSILWVDSDDFFEDKVAAIMKNEFNDKGYIWINAKKVKWRRLPDSYMGDLPVYVDVKELDLEKKE